MKNIQAGIIGAAGYTGGELIRVLLQHPFVKIAFAQSSSNAGKFISDVHTDLLGETTLAFTADFNTDIDVLFLCAGHGEAKKFIQANNIPENILVIDIGNDFRLHADATIGNRTFVYGLPELNKHSIQSSKSIANPGCFATAIQLGLLPLANANLLQNVYTTGITGSTGAGQSLSTTSHFSWRVNNIQAYKTLTHQHLGEIHQSLHQLTNNKPTVHFVPWRGDFARGIFVSSTIECSLSLDELNALYNNFYQNHPFVHISIQPIHLKQVINTNKCIIQIEKENNHIVIHSIIDNLLKGAVGQAVQNMNIIFGLPETTGLQLKSVGL